MMWPTSTAAMRPQGETGRTVNVVNGLTGENLQTLNLPESATIQMVKRKLGRTLGYHYVLFDENNLEPFPEDMPMSRLTSQMSTACDSQPTSSVEPMRRLSVEDCCQEHDEGAEEICVEPEPIRIMSMKVASCSHSDFIAQRALLLAAQAGDAEKVDQMLNVPTWPDGADSFGRTALHIAAQDGHLEVVRLLCEAGASVDQAAEDGMTPLLVAAENGYLEIVRTLCDFGAAVKHKDSEGRTALSMACRGRHRDIARLLWQWTNQAYGDKALVSNALIEAGQDSGLYG